jgi:hypothetical protein
MDTEMTAGADRSGCEDPIEGIRSGQARGPGQAQIVRHRGNNAVLAPIRTKVRSGGQALAAPRAARIDDGATRTSRHASAESVPTSTLDPTGLECTLHDFYP